MKLCIGSLILFLAMADARASQAAADVFDDTGDALYEMSGGTAKIFIAGDPAQRLMKDRGFSAEKKQVTVTVTCSANEASQGPPTCAMEFPSAAAALNDAH